MVEPPDSTSTFSVEFARDEDTAYDEVNAYELLIANDADTAQLLVPMRAPRSEPVYDPVIGAVNEFNCNELLSVPAGSPDGRTYEEVIALDDVTAQLAVPTSAPRSDPVYDPVIGAVNELSCSELDINVGLFTTLAYSTNDAVSALDAVPVSRDAVSPFPIIFIPLLETVSDPVITALPTYGNPTPVFETPKKLPLNEPE